MNLQDATILLVDDNTHTRLLAKTLLLSMGCQPPLEAANGQEAVELFQLHQPNLTILDINMPIMDGKQALEQIISEFPNAVVVMWSSLEAEDTIRECIELGASNFIRKHEPMEVFVEMVAAHIQEL